MCGCLLRHGALSLLEIVRRLELSPRQVKNSLLILIQHNCVQAYTSPRGKTLCETLLLASDLVDYQNLMPLLGGLQGVAIRR